MERRNIEVYLNKETGQAIVEFSMNGESVTIGLPVKKVRTLRRKLKAAEYQLEGKLKELDDE